MRKQRQTKNNKEKHNERLPWSFIRLFNIKPNYKMVTIKSNHKRNNFVSGEYTIFWSFVLFEIMDGGNNNKCFRIWFGVGVLKQKKGDKLQWKIIKKKIKTKNIIENGKEIIIARVNAMHVYAACLSSTHTHPSTTSMTHDTGHIVHHWSVIDFGRLLNYHSNCLLDDIRNAPHKHHTNTSTLLHLRI